MGCLVGALVASILLSLNFGITESAPESALVTKLPGFNGSFPSKHYAGYVALDNEGRKNLWYYFVESERNASADPVVLWLNGGPGCSSMDGFIYEHDPMFQQWFKKFPEFQSNPFFLSGESYAGIFVPTLASQIVKGNKNIMKINIRNETRMKNKTKPIINLKGYLVGNGITDPVFDGNAMVPFVHGMGLISDELFEETKAACKGKYYDDKGTYISDECSHKVGKVINAVGLIDPSNILEPCNVQRSLPVRKRMFRRAWPLGLVVRLGILPSWSEFISTSDIPCLDNIVATTWLNHPAVRKAVHAKEKSKIGRWELCTNKIKYQTDAGSMIEFHRNLTLGGYHALIFSGDHDKIVPYTGSEAWTKSMGYKVVDEWRPWMSNDQVAGYTQGYANNLTFLTIKGAGHSVPEVKPREALDFYRRFLAGEKI